MVDYHKELVNALKTIGINVQYEMSLTSKTKTPCISYMETNNYTMTEPYKHSTFGYSRITYQIKVWANDISLIQRYALDVDRVLRPLGFKRISSGELYDNNSAMIQKIMTYEAIAYETY